MKPTDSPTFCPHLWLSACHSNGGFFKPCCQYIIDDHSNKWGQGFEHNQKAFDRDRLMMMQGGKPSGCGNCFEEEASGLSSLRTETLGFEWWKSYLQDINENTDRDGGYRHSPVYFDLKLGTKCNLACRMCSPESSSLIEKEVEDHKELFQYHTEAIQDLEFVKKHFTNDAQIDLVFEAIKEVGGGVEVKFTGGEPFLNKRIPEFLDHCIEKDVAKNIKIHFTTNLTVIADEVLEKLKKFKWCGISVSMEGIKDSYEYVRYPATWSKFQKNLDKLKQFNIWVTVVYTGNALTICEFPEWLEWVLSEGLTWNYNPVVSPKWLNIKVIPQELKTETIRRLEMIKPRFDSKQSTINGVVNMMKEPRPMTDWQFLLKDIAVKDRIRSQSIHKSIPDLGNFIPVDRS